MLFEKFPVIPLRKSDEWAESSRGFPLFIVHSIEQELFTRAKTRPQSDPHQVMNTLPLIKTVKGRVLF